MVARDGNDGKNFWGKLVLIHTSLQRGGWRVLFIVSRFNGFNETVKTVQHQVPAVNTSLKRGVNEKNLRSINVSRLQREVDD
jgi:hypothetical protein